MIRWYIVQTLGGAEWEAWRSIQRPRHDGSLRCEEAYFPFWIGPYRKHRYHHGMCYAHFPTYIFAALSERQPVADIKGCLGVKEIIRSGLDYVTMKPEHMDALKERVRKFWDRPFDAVTPNRIVLPKVGDWISIPNYPLGNAFAGIPALVEDVDKQGRISVAAGTLRFAFPRAAFLQSADASA